MELLKIEFEVPGKPRGKGRPRFCKSGFAYTPHETRAYENLIIKAYKDKHNGMAFAKGKALKINITAVFEPNKSDSRNIVEKKLNGEIKPTIKPDCDNIEKVVCDALNGVAYYDDSQIVKTICRKTYGEKACIQVELSNDYPWRLCGECDYFNAGRRPIDEIDTPGVCKKNNKALSNLEICQFGLEYDQSMARTLYIKNLGKLGYSEFEIKELISDFN